MIYSVVLSEEDNEVEVIGEEELEVNNSEIEFLEIINGIETDCDMKFESEVKEILNKNSMFL